MQRPGGSTKVENNVDGTAARVRRALDQLLLVQVLRPLHHVHSDTRATLPQLYFNNNKIFFYDYSKEVEDSRIKELNPFVAVEPAADHDTKINEQIYCDRLVI